MTPKEYRELARKKRSGSKPKPKYGNKKAEYDNISFDSKAEMRRYKELKLLERSGAISDIELQPKYILQESFKYAGKTERQIAYTPDFRYVENGKIVVEEVKGFADTSYKIRRKLFLYKHQDIDFRELNL